MSSDNALAVQNRIPSVYGIPAPMTLQETLTLGDVLAKSGFFQDARSAAQAVVKVLAGRELGFGPLASMTGIHIIEGKPSIGSHLLAAAIRSSKRYDFRIVEHTDQVCAIQFLKSVDGKMVEDGPPERLTIQEAHEKGWTVTRKNERKDPWFKTPKNMLFARAITNGYRFHCPDLVGGVLLYDPDELDAERIPAVVTEATVNGTAEPASVPVQAVPVETPTQDENAGRITEGQEKRLVELIQATGTDVKKLLFAFKIHTLSQLPASEYQKVQNELIRRKGAATMPAVQQPASAVEQPVSAQEPAVSAVITEAQYNQLAALVKAKNVSAGDVIQFVGVDRPGAVPAGLFTLVRLLVENGVDLGKARKDWKIPSLMGLPADRLDAITRGQLRDRIDSLVNDLQVPLSQLNDRAQQMFGTTDFSKLTTEQLEQLEQRLADYKAKSRGTTEKK